MATRASGPVADASSTRRSAEATAAPRPVTGHVDGVDSVVAEPPHEPGAFVEAVDGEDLGIAPAGERLAGELGPAEHADRRLGGQGVDELVDRRVVLELVGAAPSLLVGIADAS